MRKQFITLFFATERYLKAMNSSSLHYCPSPVLHDCFLLNLIILTICLAAEDFIPIWYYLNSLLCNMSTTATICSILIFCYFLLYMKHWKVRMIMQNNVPFFKCVIFISSLKKLVFPFYCMCK